MTRFRAKSDVTPSAYVTYHRQHPLNGIYSDIDLPPEDLVAMVDRLMLRIQAGLRPQVTWFREDKWILHTTALRWQTPAAQLQLEARLNSRGTSLWLHP